MNRLWSFLSQFPAWSVVLSVAGLIGAFSAILAVLLYRDIAESDEPLPVSSRCSSDVQKS